MSNLTPFLVQAEHSLVFPEVLSMDGLTLEEGNERVVQLENLMRFHEANKHHEDAEVSSLSHQLYDEAVKAWREYMIAGFTPGNEQS